MRLHTTSLPRLAVIILSAVALTLGGCSSSKKATSKTKTTSYVKPKPSSQNRDVSLEGLSGSERTLISEARQWLGTPYKYGGNTRSGVDCSGFVYHVYRNSLDISLPRNSARQHDYCSKVKREDLATGDLVFFATNKGSRSVSHVGLYVGDNKMIHASTRRGVIVQDLSDDYYKKAYVGAGRVSEFASLTKADKKKKSAKAKSKSENATPERAPERAKEPTPVKSDKPAQQETEAASPVQPGTSATPGQGAATVAPADSPFYEFETPESDETPANDEPTATSGSSPAVIAPESRNAQSTGNTPETASSATIQPAPAKAVKISPSPTQTATTTGEARTQVLSKLPDLQ
ncbi:MAG: NlpC/P60 family protein [Candidatus Amulumruptor caecigallinarius]|nr:NlpC/P60 family protein [Candidatus Amulumruptor caecigallinarius]MCM1397334.1 NlpC/P60 family protein [Candidatus Amulumruptor caecigallinarius]MCM1453602.1 NlpC/P60 family protein [bacterium]